MVNLIYWLTLGPMITVEQQRAPVPHPEAEVDAVGPEVDVDGVDQEAPVVDVVVVDGVPPTTGTATTTNTMTTVQDRGEFTVPDLYTMTSIRNLFMEPSSHLNVILHSSDYVTAV